MAEFPRPLAPVDGPFDAATVDGAVAGMGPHGQAIESLVATGFVQPDLITGMTLTLLAGQPRRPRGDGTKKPGATAGGVWVREQYTVHRPLPRGDAWRIEGEGTGTYARKGRSYSTTASRSVTSEGERFATNLTTGLFSYRPDPDLADSVQGLPLDQTPSPQPDWQAAESNPHLDALRSLEIGRVFGGQPAVVTLAMMAARATDRPDNPIHSDVEEAKRAGLARPIAGGSHVLAFGLEPIMAGLGDQVLLHGANFDVRWKAPTECEVTIVPTATVTAADDGQVVFDLRIDLSSGPTAMVGTVTIPLP